MSMEQPNKVTVICRGIPVSAESGSEPLHAPKRVGTFVWTPPNETNGFRNIGSWDGRGVGVIEGGIQFAAWVNNEPGSEHRDGLLPDHLSWQKGHTRYNIRCKSCAKDGVTSETVIDPWDRRDREAWVVLDVLCWAAHFGGQAEIELRYLQRLVSSKARQNDQREGFRGSIGEFYSERFKVNRRHYLS